MKDFVWPVIFAFASGDKKSMFPYTVSSHLKLVVCLVIHLQIRFLHVFVIC